MKTIVWPCAAGLLCLTSQVLAQGGLSPGLYEYNGTVTMEGMPGGQPTAFSGKQCMTAQDLADGGQKALTSGSGGNNPCTYTNYNATGSTATWSMSCQAQGYTMNGGGSASFNAGGYNVRSENLSQMMGMNIKTITVLSGRRVGDCTQSTMGAPTATPATSHVPASQPAAMMPAAAAAPSAAPAANASSAGDTSTAEKSVRVGTGLAVWAGSLGGVDPKTLQIVVQANEMYSKVAPYLNQAQAAASAASGTGDKVAALAGKLRSNSGGQFVLPYNADGQPTEWATKALQAAATGALAGVAADKATDAAVSAAGSALSSVPFGGLVSSLFGGAAKDKAKSMAQDLGVATALGGWDSIRASSNQSFDNLDDMLVFMTTKYASADTNYLYALAATVALYPDAKDRFEPALKAHFGVN